jgi:hypothetical protein
MLIRGSEEKKGRGSENDQSTYGSVMIKHLMCNLIHTNKNLRTLINKFIVETQNK